MFRQTSASECVEGHEEAPRGSLERMESEAEGTRLFNEKETRRGEREDKGQERRRRRRRRRRTACLLFVGKLVLFLQIEHHIDIA